MIKPLEKTIAGIPEFLDAELTRHTEKTIHHWDNAIIGSADQNPAVLLGSYSLATCLGIGKELKLRRLRDITLTRKQNGNHIALNGYCSAIHTASRGRNTHSKGIGVDRLPMGLPIHLI